VLPHRILADDPYRVVREAVLAAFPDSTVADSSFALDQQAILRAHE
jgi:hypothetical protein